MARVVSIGAQDFDQLISNDCFYVDKTLFIKEWWENKDIVTLITRPRRFGKTLNMSMMERFWSNKYAGQNKIFQNLAIWKEEKYRKLQGIYPVISLSFADVKEDTYEEVKNQIFQIITDLYSKYYFLRDCGELNEKDKEYFDRIGKDMSDSDASKALHRLSDYLYRYYGKKVIILLDEYDTPMQEAFVQGFWDKLVSFTRSLFNSTFKTNPYMERAIMTGITYADIVAPSSLSSEVPRQVSEVGFPTRLGKTSPSTQCQSIFSDLNNLTVITTTSDEYADCFGFTEDEVFEAMDEYGMGNKEEVKKWYDGFTFGSFRDIYNPWSIINFLNSGKLKPYWANTSSNSLVGNLLRQGNKNIKMQFEQLLLGESIESRVDEEIVYNQLEQNEDAVWSLLLASGYLKVLHIEDDDYELTLTNYEVKKMFSKMVRTWFRQDGTNYNDFIKALLQGDIDAMNEYMNRIMESLFSIFDGGNKPSSKASPERFYHGFVLGLLVDLSGRYVVTSNRESGFGRYDVMLEPLNKEDDGIILEFKVYNPKRETDLTETLQAALKQIEEKRYEQTLIDHGVKKEHIRKYGFAFEGKTVLIG